MPDDEPQRRPSQIWAELLGIPERRFTEEEERAFRERMRQADAKLEEILARRRRSAA
ncbi:hypothetical protein [Actinoplanes sp. NPDC049802]|uniref:hypothetical protein n=1 Tax=Actinoplanes sp. NPDC049802 TaxID=3154742 RepID=UPI003409DB63